MKESKGKLGGENGEESNEETKGKSVGGEKMEES